MKKYWGSLLLILSSCMVGPNYKPPENTTPDEWKGGALDVDFSTQEPVVAWWKVFGDPLLEKYIQMAAEHNQDLLVAEERILQARALRQVAAADLFPQIMADVNASKTYFSKNGPVFVASSLTQGSNVNTGLPFALQVPQIQPLYNALFDASWELDLFGKTRRSIQAAVANIESAIELRNDTLISVMAEIARNYMEVRSNQKLAQLLQEDIALVEKNLELVQKSLESGLIDRLNLENIQAELARARADLPNTIAQVYRGIYSLSILTGNLPEALVEELMVVQELPALPKGIAVGVRSDILRRRPDVRKSERDLAAATANIGVAVASFYPTVTLSGDGGFQSLRIGNLFQAASRTWSIGGDITMPVFQGGRLVGNLRATEAAARAAAYTYQQTVLRALQDAESVLISYAENTKATDELGLAVDRDRNLVSLTKERYTRGLIKLTDLLTAQRQLVSAEERKLTGDTTALLSLISLYKALGGGWQPHD